MRASGMDDVIFSGTTQRPSRNMAEVMVTMSNDDRSAPPQHNDSEVIEISRRIEREAGSAYRINGKDVRARDVQLVVCRCFDRRALAGAGAAGTDRRDHQCQAAGAALDP